MSLTNYPKLKEKKIKNVLKVNGISEGVKFLRQMGINTLLLDIEDMPDFDATPFFDEIVDFIDNALQNEEGIVVVCTAGISRSATACIVYLMAKRNMSLKEAFLLVKSARPFIKPNAGFMA